MNTGAPRCICLSGVDGTGKSTQARAIAARLARDGERVQVVWLRFPRLTCAPLLAYARWRGYSRREQVDGYEHGYWDFRASWLMRNLFPPLLLLDTAIVTGLRVRLPLLRGATVIVDRCALDTLVDLMTGLDVEGYDTGWPGRLFLSLLPAQSILVVVDLDTVTCSERSPELRGDRAHSVRRAIYLDVARRHRIPVVSSRDAPVEVTRRILELIYERNRMPGLAVG